MNELQMSSKCSLYRNFKVELKMEKYLCVLPNPLKFALIKFRTSNHKLPIETGRYDNTERKDRICTLCSVKDIGDEYHYLFSCQYFNDIRLLYVPKKFVSKPSVAKFCEYLKTRKKQLLVKMALFAKIICMKFLQEDL